MKLIIGEKEYTLEYTFEAVASEDCVKKAVELLTSLDDKEKKLSEQIGMMPNTVISLFHGGLLENHSEEVQCEKDARELLKQYMKENKGDNEATFYGVMMKIIEQMGEDGFLAQIGLGETSPKKEQKTPQDRKRKTTTKKTEA